MTKNTCEVSGDTARHAGLVDAGHMTDYKTREGTRL